MLLKINVKSTRNSSTLNYPIGLHQPKSQILFYKNISPRDFYEIILPLTKCWKNRNSFVNIFEFQMRFQKCFDPIVQKSSRRDVGLYICKSDSNFILSQIQDHFQSCCNTYTYWQAIYLWIHSVDTVVYLKIKKKCFYLRHKIFSFFNGNSFLT